jgi:hypothetical protein
MKKKRKILINNNILIKIVIKIIIIKDENFSLINKIKITKIKHNK